MSPSSNGVTFKASTARKGRARPENWLPNWLTVSENQRWRKSRCLQRFPPGLRFTILVPGFYATTCMCELVTLLGHNSLIRWPRGLADYLDHRPSAAKWAFHEPAPAKSQRSERSSWEELVVELPVAFRACEHVLPDDSVGSPHGAASPCCQPPPRDDDDDERHSCDYRYYFACHDQGHM